MVLAQRAPDCDYLYKTVSQVRTGDSIPLLSTSALRLPISLGPLLLILSDQTGVWESAGMIRENNVILGFLTRRRRDGHVLERGVFLVPPAYPAQCQAFVTSSAWQGWKATYPLGIS